MLGISKGVSTELICPEDGCQKALAVHASLLLTSSQPSVMVEGELISAQPELSTDRHSNV